MVSYQEGCRAVVLAVALTLAACQTGPHQDVVAVPPVSDRLAQAQLTEAFLSQRRAGNYYLLSANQALQATDAACSVASVAMVVSALRQQAGLGGGPVTQQAVLERVGDPGWALATAHGGDGVSFAAFLVYLRRSLDAFDLQDAGIEVYRPASTPEALGQLRALLAASERDGGGLVVAAYDQGTLTADVHVGHISPIGAYDPERHLVLVMDVDPATAAPYWSRDEDLLAALLRPDLSDPSGNGLVRVSLP